MTPDQIGFAMFCAYILGALVTAYTYGRETTRLRLRIERLESDQRRFQ